MTDTVCRLAVNPDAPICKPDSPALAVRGFACSGHLAKVERAVSEVSQAIRALRSYGLAPGSSGSGDRVTGSAERRDAMRVATLDVIRDLERTPGLDTIVFADDPKPLLEVLQQTLADAHNIVPWRVERQHLPIRCPDCWGHTVYRDSGADNGYCSRQTGGCGRRIPEAELAQLDAEHASDIAYQLEQAAQARDDRQARTA